MNLDRTHETELVAVSYQSALRLAITDWEQLVAVLAFVALLSAGSYHNLTFGVSRLRQAVLPD